MGDLERPLHGWPKEGCRNMVHRLYHAHLRNIILSLLRRLSLYATPGLETTLPGPMR
jgi:hypothetical protein